MAKQTKTKPLAWQNRIVGHGEESPDQILYNPFNFRIHPKHQQEALEGVLNQVGWVQNVIVNRTTGHLIDGHLRVKLAEQRQEPTIPVIYVELTEAEEALVLATIDPISALATTDSQKLGELLEQVNTDEAALQQMLSNLAQSVGIIPPDVEFKEFDESAADDVEYHECPECGHKWPK